MKAQRLEALPGAATARSSSRPQMAVFAQRHSTFGGGCASAPPLLDSGRPLPAATRHEMERGFGRDFSAIRVHDDARAHDNARSLGALAYAAGNDIVFGEGRYAPHTAAGRALIAHELAHSVQQGGVQMKADGSLPVAADQRLEAEADRAAAAITARRPAPALSRVGTAAVFRQTTPPAAVAEEGAGEEFMLTSGARGRLVDDAGPGADFVSVRMAKLVVPPKGSGEWVSKRYESQTPRLIYDARLENGQFKSDQVNTGGYRELWTRKYGLGTLQKAAEALESCPTPPTDAVAKEIVSGFKKGKTGSCAIDHIVEKQLKGDNDPENLQLLGATTNSSAGSMLRGKLSNLASDIRREVRPHITGIRIAFDRVEVSDAEDGLPATDKYTEPSVAIEALLRSGTVSGDESVKQQVASKPISLRFEKASAVTAVRASGATAIVGPAASMIKGIRLISYQRAGAKGKDKGTDQVRAELEMLRVRPAKDPILFDAKADPVPPEPGPGESEPAEHRELTIPAKPSAQFEYIGLSKGALTSYWVRDGVFGGTGTITPSIGFLGPIAISYEPPELKVSALDAAKFKSIGSVVHFTGGKLTLTLTPELKVEGNILFAVGPKAKPLLTGDISARVEGGVFIATGNLTAGKMPGIDDLSGTATYRSDTGWTGSAIAKSSSLPLSTTDAKFNFWQDKGGAFKTKAEGAITTSIRDKAKLKLDARWDAESGISYKGDASIDNPIKGVGRVFLTGTYTGGLLKATGEATIGWEKFKPTIAITYTRRDGDERGRFSGTATVDAAIGKASGKLTIGFGEQGLTSLAGTLTYKFNDRLQPTLGVKLDEEGRVKLSGEIALPDIELTKKWPAGGGEFTLIKGGWTFYVAPPIPIVDLFCKISGSLRLAYGVGPVTLTKIKFDGSLYPFESDLRIEARLHGKLTVPAYASLIGILSVAIGAELLWGAAGAEGSLTLTGKLTVPGSFELEGESYYKDGFGFFGEARIKGQMLAELGIDLDVELYTAWKRGPGKKWHYPVTSMKRQIGPDLDFSLGRFGQSLEETKVPAAPAKGAKPSAEAPAELNPESMLKKLLSKEETRVQH